MKKLSLVSLLCCFCILLASCGESGGYMYTVKLFNVKGKSEFEFFDKKLTGILFHFEGEKEKLEPFGEKALKELVKLYSDKYELKEQNSGTKAKRNSFVWELAEQDGEGEGNGLFEKILADIYIG